MFDELNVEALLSFHKNYAENFNQKNSLQLSLVTLFVATVARTIKDFPAFQNQIINNQIKTLNSIDINIASPTKSGIALPILVNVPNTPLPTIEQLIADISVQAQINQLETKINQNGCITIANNGNYGAMLANPTLNPPQSATFGINKIQPKPIVENGEIVIKPMMFIALTYDFRIIDSQIAVHFLTTIRKNLENIQAFLD